MRSRSPLALMEQLVMVLVFALAAALCLQAFAFADRMSARNEAVDRAVVECQRVAELLKEHGGMEPLALPGGAGADMTTEAQYYNESWDAVKDGGNWAYQLTVTDQTPPAAGLKKALVRVSDREDSELFSLSVVWQEVNSRG